MNDSSSAIEVVEGMLARSVPFDHIEDYIDGESLSADAKSALWLYAWAETDRHERRRVVGELVLGMTG